MPRIGGDTLIHVEELDYIVEVDYPLHEFKMSEDPNDPVTQAIAQHIADLIPDGATLQLGIGALPDSVLPHLVDKKDLGIHTELFSDGVMALAEKGVITGARKTLHPGKITALISIAALQFRAELQQQAQKRKYSMQSKVDSLANDKLYESYNADSRDFIQRIPDASIDLILTDPPYNLSLYSTGNLKFARRKEINNDLAAWDKTTFTPAEWRDEFKRILKPTGNIFVFTCYNLLGQWHTVFDPEFDTFQFMVWHKTNPAPKIRRAGFLNSCELIVCMWNSGHIWNFGKQSEMHNFIESPICMGNERLKDPAHPTQKPVKRLQHIIKVATKPDAIVFDPFMGVGSSGVAALHLGRRFIGIELEERYFVAAEQRLRAAATAYGIAQDTAPLLQEPKKYGENTAIGYKVVDEHSQVALAFT